MNQGFVGEDVSKILLINDIGTALLDMAMPRFCIICRRCLNLRERHICLHCMEDFPYTLYWERVHNPMADRFNERLNQDIAGVLPYVNACALFFFNAESGYTQIPYFIKYLRGVDIAYHFAHIFGTRLSSSPQYRDVDLIVPVPLHFLRRMRRGYNQAELLARGIASAYPYPPEVRTDLLTRRKYTKTQVKMSMSDKESNVSNAFKFSPHKLINTPKHILLVDDTFTTGSTLYSCFKAMGNLSGVKISIVTLAFVKMS